MNPLISQNPTGRDKMAMALDVVESSNASDDERLSRAVRGFSWFGRCPGTHVNHM
jgi:hypothetical protein